MKPHVDEVSYATFAGHFISGDREHIRVLVDWPGLEHLLDTGSAHIYRFVDELSDEVLANAMTPWFVDADGRKAAWLGQGARPLRVREAAAHPWAPGSSRARVHRDFAAWRPGEESQPDLPVSESQIDVSVATLELAPHVLLILDGNHRLLSLYRLQAGGGMVPPVRIVEYRITASPQVAAGLLEEGQRFLGHVAD